MPRPRNNTLREFFFDIDNPNDIVCSNGSCDGRKLSDRAGNLERHLRIMHPKLYAAYMEQKGTSVAKKPETDPYIVKHSCGINRNNAEVAIVEFFTKSGVALQMIEQRCFKTLTQPVLTALNMSATVANLLEKIAAHSERVKEETVEELKGNLLSLKIDVVCKPNQCFVSISAQYAANYSIAVRTLSIKRCERRLSNEELIAWLQEITEEYEIATNQIITITTDNVVDKTNAASNIKGLLEDTNGTYSPLDIMYDFTGSVFSSSGTANMQCCTHVLHSCIDKVLQTDVIEQRISNWMLVVESIDSNPDYRNNVECGYKLPEVDNNPTRWRPTLIMFETLFEQKDMIKSDCFSANPKFLLDDDDFVFMENLLNVLKIFRNACNELQTETICFSQFYIILMDMILKIGNLPRSNIQSYTLEALKTQKSKQMDSDLFISAIFLDPRVRVTLTPGQIVRAKHFIALLSERLNAVKEKHKIDTNAPTAQETEEPSSSTQTPQTLDEFLQCLDTTPVNKIAIFANSSEVEIKVEDDEPSSSCTAIRDSEEFLPIQNLELEFLLYDRQPRMQLSENILEYWRKQNNTLSLMAEAILAIPCTRITMKRLCMSLDYVASTEHANIEPQSLEHILLLRANNSFSYER